MYLQCVLVLGQRSLGSEKCPNEIPRELSGRINQLTHKMASTMTTESCQQITSFSFHVYTRVVPK